MTHIYPHDLPFETKELPNGKTLIMLPIDPATGKRVLTAGWVAVVTGEAEARQFRAHLAEMVMKLQADESA